MSEMGAIWPLIGPCIGRTSPIGPKGIASGIAKRASTRALRLTKTGFVGDEQGDRRHHGGPEKAVHHFPHDHYSRWIEEIGPHPILTSPAAFGENIATAGLTEEGIAIGDRFRLGNAIIEVSQGRQPCFRINLRFGRADMARRMQQNGRTGWYCRVVEEGVVAPGDVLRLVERPTPDWTIARLHRAFYVDPLDRGALSQIADLSRLAERWRALATRRLQTDLVEDWSARLDGPQ